MALLFSIISLFVLMAFSVSAQEVSYKSDAIQLAARLTAGSPTAEISEHLIYSIEDALVSISQSSFVAAQAVAYKYHIHTANSTNTQNVRIIIGKETNWGEDFSNSPVHKLFPSYQFNIKAIEETDTYLVLDISANQPMNMKFIASELSVLDEIWMVELPSTPYWGNDIHLRQVEEGYIITFSYKTGSKDADNIETHYWDFGVSHSGEVSFIGEHGADLSTATTSTENNFYTLLNGASR